MKFYNAGSGEIFGEQSGFEPTTESSPIALKSPYGVAKASAYMLTKNYREAYGLHCCTGILFNHQSILQPERFVTRKIILTASRIAAGSREKLQLGNISIQRDWGLASEYVEAMNKILNNTKPTDLIVATGIRNRLENFTATVFDCLGLDWREHCVISLELNRPSEIMVSWGNPKSTYELLGWKAKTVGKVVIESLLAEEIK